MVQSVCLFNSNDQNTNYDWMTDFLLYKLLLQRYGEMSSLPTFLCMAAPVIWITMFLDIIIKSSTNKCL